MPLSTVRCEWTPEVWIAAHVPVFRRDVPHRARRRDNVRSIRISAGCPLSLHHLRVHAYASERGCSTTCAPVSFPPALGLRKNHGAVGRRHAWLRLVGVPSSQERVHDPAPRNLQWLGHSHDLRRPRTKTTCFAPRKPLSHTDSPNGDFPTL